MLSNLDLRIEITRADRVAASRKRLSKSTHTPSPPTKSLDFRGFDSSKLLILRGGSSHVRII